MRRWLISIAAVVGFLLASYIAVRYLLPVLLPFVLAALLAEALNPLVEALSNPHRRLALPRGLAVGLVLVVTMLLLAWGLTLAVAALLSEIKDMVDTLPAHQDQMMDLANRTLAWLGAFSESLPRSVQPLLQQAVAEGQVLVKDMLTAMVGSLSAVTYLPVLATNLVVALIATFFLSKDRQVIGQFLLSLMPEDMRVKVRRVKDDVWASAMGFGRALLVLITLTAIMTVIGLSLMGSTYALTIGIVVGIADILPVLGPTTIYLPWIAYHLLFGSPLFGAKLLVLYLVVAGVRQVLESRVVGSSMGLHPLATLFSMYLGFLAFGALGFAIGPLLATLLKAMVKSNLLPFDAGPAPPG